MAEPKIAWARLKRLHLKRGSRLREREELFSVTISVPVRAKNRGRKALHTCCTTLLLGRGEGRGRARSSYPACSAWVWSGSRGRGQSEGEVGRDLPGVPAAGTVGEKAKSCITVNNHLANPPDSLALLCPQPCTHACTCSAEISTSRQAGGSADLWSPQCQGH